MPNISKSARQNQVKRARARTKDYQSKLKQLKAAGIYEPKAPELTRYRKWAINKRYDEYKDLLNSKRFFFVKAPQKRQDKRHALEMAKFLKYKTTKTGMFIERDGASKGTIRKSKSRKGEFEIHLTGKYKRGPRAGKRMDSYIPLTTLDKLILEQGRLRKIAKKIGTLQGNQRLAFKVIENGLEGFSHKIFDNIEDLLKYIAQYQRDGSADPKSNFKSEMAQLNFMRHIIIVKTTVDTWYRDHPIKSKLKRRRVNRKGRNE